MKKYIILLISVYLINAQSSSDLFSDLTSLTYFDLLALEDDYKAIGYSTSEINIQKHRFYSLPFLL